MRLFALRCASKNVNCNVIVPGVTSTDAWGKLADARGADVDEMVGGIAGRIAPMGSMAPRAVGDGVAFLEQVIERALVPCEARLGVTISLYEQGVEDLLRAMGSGDRPAVAVK